MLGFRIYYNYRLLKKSNARRIWKRINKLKNMYDPGRITQEYAKRSLGGWLAYAEFANTYNLRKEISMKFEKLFIAFLKSLTTGKTA